MKKVILGGIVGFLIIFGTTACLSFTNKKTISSNDFKTKMEDKGFEVIDAMDQLPETTDIKQVYLAISPGSKYKIEFYEFTSNEAASQFYQRNKKIFELTKENNTKKYEKSKKNYSKYIMNNGNSYRVISKIGKTAMYVDEKDKYKEVINETLKDLGY